MAYYPPLSPMQVGMACKCPRCGQGELYKGFTTLQSACSVCGLDYAKADSGDGPAVFLIFLVGFLAIVFAFILQFGFGAPIWLVLLLSFGFTGLLIGCMIRPLKAVMIAQQYAQKAAEGSFDENKKDWQ